MEDWSKSLFEGLETAATEVEQFFVEVSEEMTEIVDALGKFSQEVLEEVQNNLISEVDHWFNEIVEPIIEVYFDFDTTEVSEIEPFVNYVEPTSIEHPACQGCRNYHGQVYGGNLLVCAMHPSGVEGEGCPDWESY